MEVCDKYTTADKITADKDGIETKKIILSNDAYAVSEMITELIRKIEQTRAQFT